MVLWSGCFVTWIEILTSGRIFPDKWTDCKLGYFLFYFGRHYSSMLLVLMSIEKCFVVYFPLKSKTLCTVKTAKWTTGIVGFILIGYNLQYLIISEAIVDNNGSEYCEFQISYTDTLELVDSVLYSFGPFLLMLITNFAIIYKFVRAKCKSKINSTESTSQALSKAATRGTAMVVTVSVTFLILTAPTAVNSVLLRWYALGILYRAFMNSTQYLNHGINGVLYCIVGSKFRRELLNIFFKKKSIPGITTSHSEMPT